MTKQYFIELSEYNIWANKKTCSWFEKINGEQWKQNIVSSFSSIEATALHIAGAEKIWLDRLSKKEILSWLPNTFNGSKAELISIWLEISGDLKKLVDEIPGSLLADSLSFKNIKGIEFNLPYYQLFTHVFNHSTYHRGQLVTMLRQVGFTEMSSLDFTTYLKEKNG